MGRLTGAKAPEADDILLIQHFCIYFQRYASQLIGNSMYIIFTSNVPPSFSHQYLSKPTCRAELALGVIGKESVKLSSRIYLSASINSFKISVVVYKIIQFSIVI